jgi:hypothetical protein
VTSPARSWHEPDPKLASVGSDFKRAAGRFGSAVRSMQERRENAIAYAGSHRAPTNAALTLNAARRNHAARNAHDLRYFDIEEITGAREPTDVQDIRARILDALKAERW